MRSLDQDLRVYHTNCLDDYIRLLTVLHLDLIDGENSFNLSEKDSWLHEMPLLRDNSIKFIVETRLKIDVILICTLNSLPTAQKLQVPLIIHSHNQNKFH